MRPNTPRTITTTGMLTTVTSLCRKRTHRNLNNPPVPTTMTARIAHAEGTMRALSLR